MRPLRRVLSFLILTLCLILAPIFVHAQSIAPSSSPQWQLGAGYSSVSGPTSNGQLYFIGKQVGDRVWAVAKIFTLSNPSGVIGMYASPRYRIPVSAVWKPNSYLDTSKFLVSADLNLGVTKDALSTTRFSYGAGLTLDYQAASNVTLMLLEVDYLRGKMLPAAGIIVTNLNSLTSGIKFTF